MRVRVHQVFAVLFCNERNKVGAEDTGIDVGHSNVLHPDFSLGDDFTAQAVRAGCSDADIN